MNKLISLILILFGASVLNGCSNEDEISPSPNIGGKRMITLNIAVPGSTNHVMTRAATETGSERENFIDQVYISFNSPVSGDYTEVFEIPWTKKDGKDTIMSVTCAVDYLWLDTCGSVKSIVYANYSQADVPGVIIDETKFWEGDHLNDLRKLFMSGTGSIDLENLKGTVEIHRQVAKLRLKVRPTEDCVPVGLTVLYDSIRVAVSNVANQTADTLTLKNSGQDYIHYKERGRDSLRINKRVGTNGNLVLPVAVDSCYVYENIITGYVGGKRTTMDVTIPTYDPYTKHREDLHGVFEIKGEDGSYDIKRNHVYTINVLVRSQKEPLNITSVVEPWDVRSEDIGSIEPVFTPIN